jgi:hypothetical protein
MRTAMVVVRTADEKEKQLCGPPYAQNELPAVVQQMVVVVSWWCWCWWWL